MTLAGETGEAAALGGGRVRDYVDLLKPRVMSLVVFTAAVGLFLAPSDISAGLAAIALLCIAIGAGGSGALNMWYDADIDSRMSRTANRPIPSGRVERSDALALGLIASGFSVAVLGLATNWLAAALLAFTIFFYAVVYTVWLKRSTPQNIVIGGAAGSFPPMVAWAAATGSVGPEAWVLFLVIFLWTPPHFWALALYKQSDYAAAGIPMMPNVVGAASTRRQILAYSVLLVAATLLPQPLGFAGWVYSTVAVLAGAAFVALAWRLHRAVSDRDMRLAGRRLFTFSLSYLFAIFLALLADHWLALWGAY